MYKYKNVSDVQQTITITGNVTPRVVEAGETTTSDVPIENPNFQFVGEDKAGNVQAVVTQDQPSTVTEAEMVNNETKKENE